MHGRKRFVVTFIGLLFFIAFVLGLLPTPGALIADGLGVAVPALLLIGVIIVASLSGAIASARQMMQDPTARTTTAVVGTILSVIVGIGFIAMVMLSVVR